MSDKNSFRDSLRVDSETTAKLDSVSKSYNSKKSSNSKTEKAGGRERGDEGPGRQGREPGHKSGNNPRVNAVKNASSNTNSGKGSDRAAAVKGECNFFMIDEFDYSLLKHELKHEMNIVFLVDTSASMVGRKIEQLNEFMAEAVELTEKFTLNEEIRIRIPMRVIEFNAEAKWLYGDAKKGVDHIDWTPLHVNQNCHTDTAKAIDLARSIMYRKFLGERQLRPIVVLVSDGLSDNLHKTIESIENLKCSLSGKVRLLAVCVGGANEEELISFATNDFDRSLVIRADDCGLFKRFLQSLIADSRITPVWPEEYNPVMTDTAEYNDEDDWLE